MNNNPLVSVIIACYNAEKYIDECLESLCKQTYNNIEIIICDDASKDSSFEIMNRWAEKDSRVRVLHNDKNLFAAATRNRCLQEAKRHYLMIQDVDDLSAPERTARLLAAFENENVDFISSAALCFDKDPASIFSTISHKRYPSKWDFLWGISFMHPATIFKKDCINKVGGYRVAPDTRRCQDYDLFMRLYAHGFTGMNIKDELYIYRLDRDNINRRTMESEVMEFHLRLRNYKELGLMPWGFLFALKPFVSHYYTKFKYRNL